jgi:hypothetical protein
MFKRLLLLGVAAAISSPIAAQPAPGKPATSTVPGTATGRPAPPNFAGAPATLDAAARSQVVATLGTALRERYVFPDVGERAASRIDAALKAGEYDKLSDPAAFAAQLNADVSAVAHDKHLRINSMSGPPPSPPPGAMGTPTGEAGVVRADRLAGGVGYIEVIGFPPLPGFKPVIDRAMTALKNSKALIIDVRRNGGGDPAAVSYLSSFLVPPGKPILLNEIVRRVPDTTNFERIPMMSSPTPVNFAGLPVYVLTSAQTFSGGEGFPYEVQAAKRAKVIGEVTGGGANPTGPVPLGNGLMAMVPFGRAENPITKTNWEGRGVQPDVPVPAADAFETALERLGQPPVVDIAAASQQQVFAPRAAPLPGTEAAARALVTSLGRGTPDYGSMTPEFAEVTRQQLPQLQSMVGSLGDIRSLKFVGPVAGGDIYDVTFANGVLTVGVNLAPDGKVAGGMVRPGAPGG